MMLDSIEGRGYLAVIEASLTMQAGKAIVTCKWRGGTGFWWGKSLSRALSSRTKTFLL